MNWRTCLAHQTVTGHGQFYQPDPASPDSWLCLCCPDSPRPTCQRPISPSALCPNPVSPGSAFCPVHQPQTHFLLSLLEDR